MAAEVKALFFGALGAKKIRHALRRIIGKVKQEHFNSLEITRIVASAFSVCRTPSSRRIPGISSRVVTWMPVRHGGRPRRCRIGEILNLSTFPQLLSAGLDADRYGAVRC